jgi:hypothetical protein
MSYLCGRRPNGRRTTRTQPSIRELNTKEQLLAQNKSVADVCREIEVSDDNLVERPST